MVKILWINRKVLTINGGRNRQMFFPKKNCNPLFTLKLNPCIVWVEYVPLFCKRMRLVCSSGLLLELFDDIVIIFFLWCITELVSNIDRCSTVAVYWGRKTVKKWVINREVINENHGNIDEPKKKTTATNWRHETKSKVLHACLLSFRFRPLQSNKVKWQVPVRRVWGTLTMTADFTYFHLQLNAVTSYLAWARFQTLAACWTDLDNHVFRR